MKLWVWAAEGPSFCVHSAWSKRGSWHSQTNLLGTVQIKLTERVLPPLTSLKLNISSACPRLCLAMRRSPIHSTEDTEQQRGEPKGYTELGKGEKESKYKCERGCWWHLSLWFQFLRLQSCPDCFDGVSSPNISAFPVKFRWSLRTFKLGFSPLQSMLLIYTDMRVTTPQSWKALFRWKSIFTLIIWLGPNNSWILGSS